MTHFELLGRAAAYASTVYALSLVSWAVASRVLPAGTRVGLRLATVLVGQFVGCAILVQSLGWIGQFRPVPYLAASLAAGAAVSWILRGQRPHRGLWRLCLDTARLWLDKTPLGLGYLGLLGFLFLAYRFFSFVRGIDSLTIHGPLIAEWIQLGRVTLATHWNYPQCWEYQYAPNFLFLRSDVLVVIPGLLQVGVLLLLVREVGSRLRLPGKIACLVSLLSLSNPVVWGGTMKNDPAFAIGLLLSFLALERLVRRSRGAVWILQLGMFMILGTKPSGFIYVGLLLTTFIAIWLARQWTSRYRWRDLGRLLAGTIALQTSAAAVQLYNFVRNGNPTYPIKIRLGNWVLFDGRIDLDNTSILEAGRELATWTQLLRGSSFTLGLDLPFLLMILLGGILFQTALLVRGFSKGERPDRYLIFLYVLAVSICLLWVLYTATPWTRGIRPDSIQYIRSGRSLRYAIGPICLSYTVSAAYLVRWLGRRRVFELVSSTFLVLVLSKWVLSGVLRSYSLVVLWSLLGLLAVLFAAAWAVGKLRRGVSRLPDLPRNLARAALITGIAVPALVLYVQQIESVRPLQWEPDRRELWEYVRDEVPSGTVIGTNDRQPGFGYVLLGPRLDNEIRHVRLNLQRKADLLPDELSYYYLFHWDPRSAGKIPELMARRGWRAVVYHSNTQYRVLWKREERRRSAPAEGAIFQSGFESSSLRDWSRSHGAVSRDEPAPGAGSPADR